MGKGIIILVIFLLLAGILGYAYYRYEKPVKEKEQVIYYTNLSIFAEAPDGDLVKTIYIIYLNGTVYDGGFTDKYGGVLQRVTTGNTFYIRNENMPEQKYYTSEVKFYSAVPDKSNRIVLELKERGELIISQNGKFAEGNRVILNISTNETFKDMMYCLKWSELLIFVQSESDDKLDGQIDDNYKCYETESIIDAKHPKMITLTYNTISPITPNDYLRLQFYDKDELISQNYTKRQEYLIK